VDSSVGNLIVGWQEKVYRRTKTRFLRQPAGDKLSSLLKPKFRAQPKLRCSNPTVHLFISGPALGFFYLSSSRWAKSLSHFPKPIMISFQTINPQLIL
jgi:hypothetical protein